MPARTCHATRRRNAASSTVPSAVNGVTRAVNAPRRRGVRAVAERAMRAMSISLGRGRVVAVRDVRRGRRRVARRAGRPRRRRTGGGRRRAARRGASGRRRGRRRHRRSGRGRSAAARWTRPGRRRSRGACPGAAPARMPTTSSTGRPSESSSADDQRGSAVVIRRAIARAVPDGRSTLPRRCHSTTDGSNPPAAAYQPAAASASRRNSAAPSERFGATTAAAPASRSRARTAATSRIPAGRGEDERPVAGVAARASRLSRTASPRDASTTTSASGAGSHADRRPGARRRPGAASRRPWRPRSRSRRGVPVHRRGGA